MRDLLGKRRFWVTQRPARATRSSATGKLEGCARSLTLAGPDCTAPRQERVVRCGARCSCADAHRVCARSRAIWRPPHMPAYASICQHMPEDIIVCRGGRRQQERARLTSVRTGSPLSRIGGEELTIQLRDSACEERIYCNPPFPIRIGGPAMVSLANRPVL
jgi:hypothetical protein